MIVLVGFAVEVAVSSMLASDDESYGTDLNFKTQTQPKQAALTSPEGLLWKALGGPTSEVKVSGELSGSKGESETWPRKFATPPCLNQISCSGVLGRFHKDECGIWGRLELRVQ